MMHMSVRHTDEGHKCAGLGLFIYVHLSGCAVKDLDAWKSVPGVVHSGTCVCLLLHTVGAMLSLPLAWGKPPLLAAVHLE